MASGQWSQSREAAAGLGQESLQPGRPVIRHQRHTSILAIVLRHHPHISSSEDKVRRKEFVFACLSELRRECNSLCEQPELVVLADFIFWSHAIGCQMSRPGWLLLLLADWLSI